MSKYIIELGKKDKEICEQYINGKLGDDLGDYINVTELANAIANSEPIDTDSTVIYLEADDWISVKNQLPEEYGNYLVLTDDRDIDVDTFNPRFEDSWSMCDADGFYWAVQKGIRITHWRPLPKKPDESEGA